MAKRATVKPDWLDDMLVIWGFRDARSALGYPPICPMFKERIEQPARPFEPTGYTGYEIDRLDKAVAGLEIRHRLVVMRAFKPWTARAIEIELRSMYDVTDRTWRNWLYEAAALLALAMDRVDA